MANNTVFFRFAYALVYAMMRKGWGEAEACRLLGFPLLADTPKLYRLPMPHLLRACQLANKAGGHNLFCMELGLSIRLEDFGSFARTLSFFPTGRSAFSLYNKMSWLLNEPAAPVPVLEQGEIVVRLNPVPNDRSYLPLVEHHIGTMVSLYHQATGGFGKNHLKRVCLQHAPQSPYTPEHYQQRLGCTVLFEQPYNALVIDEAAADLRLHTADTELLESTQPQFENMNSALNQQLPLRQQVVAFIHEQQDYQMSIDQLATEIGISSSTLKRRLKAENSSFQKLLDQARMQHAVQLLEQTPMEIASIAHNMGYQSPAAFSRAFKKWLGISAREYRRTFEQ